MAHVDLLGLDQKDLEWYQMFCRTVIVFVVAIIFIRIAGIRTFGTKTAFDVVVSITMGALLSRCITGHYPFFTTLATAMFLAAFHRFVAFLAARSRVLCKILEGEHVVLYEKGEKVEKNLKKHLISDKDMKKALHEENLEDFSKVKIIFLEPDGKLSIVKKE
jgi:uncharacterized membrane protein YcaP (DUF421 family)